jgi:hypothetical protein
MKAITKYRPSLTAENIQWIVETAKTSSPLTAEAYSVIAVLDPFLTKINNSSITPAYKINTKAKANSLESLGEGAESKIAVAAGTVSKTEYWKTCYDKYKLYPNTCSITEICNAQEHRYLNDMMDKEEMAEFELKEFQAYNQ